MVCIKHKSDIENILIQEHKAYRFFSKFDKVQETRKKYIVYLKKYFEYLNCYDADILLQKSPRQTEWELIEFIIKLRNENKSYYAIQNYITAVVSFFKINDVNMTKWTCFICGEFVQKLSSL